MSPKLLAQRLGPGTWWTGWKLWRHGCSVSLPLVKCVGMNMGKLEDKNAGILPYLVSYLWTYSSLTGIDNFSQLINKCLDDC